MSDINITISGKKRLLTAGKYCDKNIVITPVGGGDFSGEYVILVDELPTENIDTSAVYQCDGAYYKYSAELLDVLLYMDSNITSIYGDDAHYHYAETKPTENIAVTETEAHLYYIADENDVMYVDVDETGTNSWFSLTELMGIKFSGVINEIDGSSTVTGMGAIATVRVGWTKYLAPTGTLNITENGTHDVSEYASANVNVPQPSGTLQITANGTYDVSLYSSATVNVPGEVVEEYDGAITISEVE